MAVKQRSTQVTIIGGGMVGLSCALALARSGIRVAILESRRWQKPEQEKSDTARVSAINKASQRFLTYLETWEKLSPKAYTPLRQMHVWDSVGGKSIHFDCADIGKAELGFIVENRAMVQTFWQQLSELENVEIFCPSYPQEIVQSNQQICVKLDNKTEIISQLVIGADGKNSMVREYMAMGWQERSYDQHALVAVIEMEKPHYQTAKQVFFPQGILAALPLAELNKAAIVWSTHSNDIESLLSIQKNKFALKIRNAFDATLGEVSLISERHAFPLIMRHAHQYVQHRLALVGDAAHTIHPLAGQGVNLGYMDAASLAMCLIDANSKQRDLGEIRALRRYERWRKADNSEMISAMRYFKELFTSTSPWVVSSRNLGLTATDKMQFIKNFFMQRAMGDYPDLPRITK